jgi:two-component system, NarL family, sensor histidine kinase DegS
MMPGVMTPKEELVAEFEAEYEKLRRRIGENQQIIEQSQLEVSRYRDRNTNISAQLNRVEQNFDTIPRADIKAAYDNALDARSRLLTMQGQLEKARATQEELVHFQELLERLLGLVRGLSPDQLPSSSMRLVQSAVQDDDNGGLSQHVIISIVEAQEGERQRLARQMHDGPAQSLTNFILQAEICQRLFDRNPDRAGEELGNLKTAAGTTFQKVRDFIFDLRPMMLDDLGLIPTIRRYVEAIQDKASISTQLNILGEERRLAGHIEVMMFRSVQTILSYARDSLGAKSVTIGLDVGPEWLKASIDHDGRSFDPDTLFNVDTRDDTSGLRTLRDRIQLVGGSISVISIESKNTQYAVMLPAIDPD